jgi:hypothetical protein
MASYTVVTQTVACSYLSIKNRTWFRAIKRRLAGVGKHRRETK